MKKISGPLAVRFVLCLLAALLLSASSAWGKPTSPEQARSVVQHWLAREAAPLGAPLGGQIKDVQTFNDDSGAPAYYVVYLKPGGLVFLPADDLVEPIIGFISEATSYDPSPSNPVGALVSRDITGRVIQARQVEAKNLAGSISLAPDDPRAKARQKWTSLAAGDTGPGVGGSYISSVSDVRVAPIIQSTWTQGLNDGSLPTNPASGAVACFNYNTPPDGYPEAYPGYYDGDVYNYVTGCQATAMAQLMRYWTYPKAPPAGLGITFNIKIDGTAYTDWFWGGSLSGSAYDWTEMPLDTRSGATTAQCKEIGSLCADAGCSVNMSYQQGDSGSGAEYGAYALVHYFNYSNAIAGSAGRNNIPDAIRDNMLNSNLDAGLPCLLGIFNSSSGGGHDIICDGYGYNNATFYNHLNFGWKAETVNAWYNLPNMGTSNGYDTVGTVTYNIYMTGSGEIISGRVTNNGATPLNGVTVKASGDGKTYTTTTNANGIYALPKLPSNTTYTVTASLSGYSFTPRTVTTGTSVNSVSAPASPGSAPVVHKTLLCGNIWGANFNSGTPSLTMNQALDNNKLTFTSGGDANWFPDTSTSSYGASSARSGAITDSQYTWLQTTVSGPGTLSFYWKVSSEQGYDYLTLWIDSAIDASDANTNQISGEVDWTKYTLTIPKGIHTITWVYNKDGSNSVGSDCGWVDQVVYNRGGGGSAAIIELLLQ